MTTNGAKTLSPSTIKTNNLLLQLKAQADAYAGEKLFGQAGLICIKMADRLYDLNRARHLPRIIKTMIQAGDYMVAGKDADNAKLCYQKADEYLQFFRPIAANDKSYLNLHEMLAGRLSDLEKNSRERKREGLSLQMAKEVRGIGPINKFQAVHELSQEIRKHMLRQPGLSCAVSSGRALMALPPLNFPLQSGP